MKPKYQFRWYACRLTLVRLNGRPWDFEMFADIDIFKFDKLYPDL